MIIIAVGAWAATVLPDLAKRLTPIRSIAVYVAPPSELAADWAAAPCTMIETRESMLYALPPVPGAPFKLAGTANLRAADPNRSEPVSPKEARAVIDAFRPYLSNIDKYNIIGAAMGHYADPPDKTFILERRDRMMIVLGCGGRMFKFAPLLGEEIAAVLTCAAAAAQLDHWSMPFAACDPRTSGIPCPSDRDASVCGPCPCTAGTRSLPEPAHRRSRAAASTRARKSPRSPAPPFQNRTGHAGRSRLCPRDGAQRSEQIAFSIPCCEGASDDEDHAGKARGLDLMGLGQSEQVSFGRQGLPEPVAERCALIPSLTGLFGDNQGRRAPTLRKSVG